VAAEVTFKPASVAAPAMPSISMPTPAAAPPAAPVATAAPADDLRRIRSIDGDLQTRLNMLGVRRYEELARWSAADVQRVGAALGVGKRIQSENWIEQAQVLAKGLETEHARQLRLQGLGIQVAKPSVDEGASVPPRPAAVAAAAVAQPAPAAVPAAAAAVPKPASSAAAPAPTPSPAAPAPTGETLPFGVVRRSVEDTAQAAASTAQQPAFELPRTGAQAAAAAAAAIAAAAAASARRGTQPSPEPPAAVASRDDLQRIRGINSEIERLLNAQGIVRFTQIAGWTPADTDRFNGLLGNPGRIGRENWIEQAAMLAGAGAAYTKRADVALRAEADTPRPARLADAIREREVTTKPAESERPAVRPDLSNLRSVRSEALRGETPTGAVDDLKRIRGIGVLIEKKLNSLGIATYEQVANWTGADIDRVSQILDFKGRIERENWVEQARILASGGQTEFSRRVDRGDG
jgi:predicted flap endonuclease-1-like 5' DNA nuclease